MVELETQEVTKNCILIRPKGYLERLLGEKLKQTVHDVEGRGFKIYIFDFSQVSMINSLGMSGLIDSIDTIESAEAMVWFADIDPVVYPILEAAGVLEMVPDVLTLAKALERAKSEADRP